VFHDLRLDRLTPARGPMRARTVAELRELGIPTLDEVLELAHGRARVMAELKSPWLHRRHDLVLRTVERVPRDAAIVSFSRAAIEETRRLRPELRTVQHVGFGTSIRTASRFAWAAGFDNTRVTSHGIARAHRLGLQALVYTVNERNRMLELRALGADGIFSDRPDLALRTVAPDSPG
jgi:glycerophosphoryl diester phosphodiesterase